VFGASAHDYRLAPPLSRAELAALERQLGPLPAEYRRFVHGLGAHGAGPCYGLLPPAPPAAIAGGAAPLPFEARVAAAFEPIIAELHAAGRDLDAEALAARSALILDAS